MEGKAHRKERSAELKSLQTRELHSFGDTALAGWEKQLKGVRRYGQLAWPTTELREGHCHKGLGRPHA
jgi:hypothetical protein